MSLAYSGVEPQPALAWTFESSNVDIVTSLAPSSQVSPGPAQLQGSASLVTNAPTSNTAVSFPGTSGSYMNLGTSSPAVFNNSTSNLFVECWVYVNATAALQQYVIMRNSSPSGPDDDWGIRYRTNGVFEFYCYGTSSPAIVQSGAVAIGQWVHVAASLTTTGNMYLFINGGTPNTSLTSGPPRYASGRAVYIGTPAAVNDWTWSNMYIRDLRVVQGGVVPTAAFTPVAAPFSYALPSYVTGSGSVVFTLLGQFITYPSGKYGQGLSTINSLSAVTSYLKYIPNSPITESTGFSISCWVNLLQLPDSGYRMTFVNLANGTGIGQGVWLAYDRYGSGTFTIYYENTGVGFATAYYNLTATTGTWYHVCGTIGKGSADVYVNGAKGTTVSYSTTGTSYSNIYVGCHVNGAPTPYIAGEMFSGTMDDLRIYNTALTAAQVQSVYSSQGAPAPSIVMPRPKYAWDFNGTTTDYVSGLALYTGFSTPFTGAYASGVYNKAVSLTNSNQGSTPDNVLNYANIPGLSVSNGITITFWAKLLNLPASGTTMLFCTNFPSSGGKFFYIGPTGASALVFGGSFGGGLSYTATQGVWFFLALTINSAGTLMTYINNNIPVVNGTNLSGYGNLTGFSLGAGYGGGPTYSLSCAIDDLRVFDRALTSAQVQSIYNQQGVPGRGVQTNTGGLLDVINTSAAVAVSLRLLRAGYTGPVVQVQRNSDLTSNNFIADFKGNLSNVQNGTTLQTFLGGTTGNVLTLYDQSGNGRDLTNYNGPYPPVIYQNSNVGLQWTMIASAPSGGFSGLMRTNMSFLDQSDFTIVATSSSAASSFSNQGLYSYGPNTGWSGTGTIDHTKFMMVRNGPGSSFNFYDTIVTSTALLNSGAQSSFSSIATRITQTGGTMFYNGAQVSSNASGTWFTGASKTFQMFRGDYYGGGPEMGELIIFPSALTSGQISSIYTSQLSKPIPATTLTGTPLFRQLSSAASSSAVGAFSLRAVNGTSAKAVNVVAGGTFPPSSMTQTGGNSSTQTLGTGGKFQGSYTASSSTSAFGWGASGAFGLAVGQPYLWQVGNYPAGGGTVSTPTTTTTGATNYNGEWLQFQTPFPINLTGYSTNTGFLTSLVLLASTTGATSSWTLVDSQSLTDGQTMTKTGLNFAGYSYFRFVVITSTTAYPYLSNVRFNGTVPSLSQDFYADRLGNLLTAPVTGQTLTNWLGGATGYVTTWYDQSGRGNHASQATAANQPVIQKATKGSGYMCVFSGAQTLSSSTLSLYNTPYSFATCERTTSLGTVTYGNNRNPIFSYGDGVVITNSTLFYHHLGTNQYACDQVNNGLLSTVTAFTNSTSEPLRYHYGMKSATSAWKLYIYNDPLGAITATSADTTLINASGKTFYIGYVGLPNYYYGELYELLVFTKSLYDLDTSGGLVTQIYQNQLSAYGT